MKPLKRSAKPIKRSRLKRVNPKRRKSEFARCYLSKQRVEFVKSLPCAACGVVGYSENAHVLGNGGLSRKGDCTTIAPLCGTRFGPSFRVGCHTVFDNYQFDFRGRFPDFDAAKAARETQTSWLAFQGEKT